MFPSFWRRRVADVRLFVNYSTFSSALRAYNASPMNSTCGTTFPPGQCSLGYTPPRSSQIRSETHVQGSPRGLNASTSKSAQLPRSIYAGVLPNVYHIWPQKRIALAGRGAKPRERQYASCNSWVGSKAKQRTILRTIHVNGFLSKHLVFGRPGNF